MGTIRRFDLRDYKETYNISTFFETGTGSGDGLAYAALISFKNLISCEIDKTTYDAIIKRTDLQFSNINILNKSSFEAIKESLPNISGNTLFWLDAHFPGELTGVAYNSEKEHDLRLPLRKELELICSMRDISKDVFIIDDLRLYEPGNYTNGQLDDIYKYSDKGYEGIDFIEKLFSKTHSINRLMTDEGYLVLLPKQDARQNYIIQQPWGIGDILFITPLVKAISEVSIETIWPVRKEFLWIKDYINLNFVEYYDGIYDAYPNHVKIPTMFSKQIMMQNSPDKYTGEMSSKYAMFGYDYKNWLNLTWNRNIEKEQQLCKLFNINVKKDKYIVINKHCGYPVHTADYINPDTNLKVVEMSMIDGFSLLDWQTILENAEEIHTVSTSIVYLLGIIPTKATIHLYPYVGHKDLQIIKDVLDSFPNWKLHSTDVVETRTDIINTLIKKYNYKSYLEIGVFDRSNYDKINIIDKTGVDPADVKGIQYNITSDEFFKINKRKFDIIFIDGLHHADQVYKDIVNSINCLNDGGVILIHDCNPTSEDMQIIPRQTINWTGDCWKAFVKFRTTNTEYDTFVINTDYGVGVIRKSANKIEPLQLSVDMNYNNLAINRKEWLNLITPNEFMKIA